MPGNHADTYSMQENEKLNSCFQLMENMQQKIQAYEYKDA